MTIFIGNCYAHSNKREYIDDASFYTTVAGLRLDCVANKALLNVAFFSQLFFASCYLHGGLLQSFFPLRPNQSKMLLQTSFEI